MSKTTYPNHTGLSGLFQRAARRHHRDSFDATPRAISGALMLPAWFPQSLLLSSGLHQHGDRCQCFRILRLDLVGDMVLEEIAESLFAFGRVEARVPG